MVTHPIIDESGKMQAFELRVWMLGRPRVTRIVASIPNVEIIRHPKLFSSFREETFCEFRLNGITFKIAQPYGKQFYYWVGQQPEARYSQELEVVEQAFRYAW